MKKKEWSVIELSRVVDVSKYQDEDIPWERGLFRYFGPGRVDWKEEVQVPGSLARYNFPKYKDLHLGMMSIIEEVIGEKLYPTYYYDMYYFKGHDLKPHTDRGSCEVSCTLNINHNLNYDWPIKFARDNCEPLSCVTNPGDAAIYSGCTITHWRDPMKGDKDSFYNQIFLHYVRRNGHYVQHAFDKE